MSGSTISNTVTIGVTLGSVAYPSPLTIEPAGYIDPNAGGLFGATGLVAAIVGGSVLNQGTVAGSSGAGNAIDPGGTQFAGGIGVDLTGGSLTNDGTVTGGRGAYDDSGYGAAGGAGVVATDSSLTNNAVILGGSGGSYGPPFGGSGGAGGDGVDLANSSLSNTGFIGGGSGASASSAGAAAGSGAIGVSGANNPSTVTNTSVIRGGSGGSSNTGSAGSGGTGLDLAAGGSLTNTGVIAGGSGGSTYTGGGGGGGGTGAEVTSGLVTNIGNISGGGGGAAGGPESFGVGGSGGTGVDLIGGSLTNSGSVNGGQGGVGGRGAGGPGGVGVALSSGATVTNTGHITGGGGNFFEGPDPFLSGGGAGVQGTDSTVINDGMIAGGYGGTGGIGVDLTGGSLSNNGTIAGGGGGFYDGVAVNAAGGTLGNYGTISGGYYGVSISAGGSLTNAASGTIIGHTGVLVTGGTVVNAGTIIGMGGTEFFPSAAVIFSGTGTDRLIDDPGAVFVGGVTVDGPDATLELASAAASGAVSGIGSRYSGFGTVAVDPGATWAVTGSVTGSGAVSLGAHSDLTFDNGVTAAVPVHFSADTGTLGIGDPGGFDAFVYGLQAGDVIDFTSVTSAGSITAGVNGSNDLTLTSAGTLLAEIRLDPVQSFAGESFYASPDGGHGTDVTESGALCFLAGTMIATPTGETPIERLRPGDAVLTDGGTVQPIVWVGTGRVLATRNRRGAATPVIVRKGAITDNVPYCDLRLTKGHALKFGDVLIPAEFLVNHRSIHWDDMAQEVVIYHIELETHGVLLANGAPAESYRDDGNRWLFQNANTGWQLAPKPACAPVLTGGEQVDAVWLHLLDRIGARPGVPLTDDPDLHLLVDGRRVDAAFHEQEFDVFMLTGPPEMGCIVSRAGAPQELGLARDPRSLGVAIRRIVVRQGARSRVLKADDPLLTKGFHAFEPANGFRWTDGNAVLPAAVFKGLRGPLEVVLQCAGAARYVDDGTLRSRLA